MNAGEIEFRYGFHFFTPHLANESKFK